MSKPGTRSKCRWLCANKDALYSRATLAICKSKSLKRIPACPNEAFKRPTRIHRAGPDFGKAERIYERHAPIHRRWWQLWLIPRRAKSKLASASDPAAKPHNAHCLKFSPLNPGFNPLILMIGIDLTHQSLQIGLILPQTKRANGRMDYLNWTKFRLTPKIGNKSLCFFLCDLRCPKTVHNSEPKPP